MGIMTKETMTSKRPETGVMVFGNDWPGVFIRGDGSWNFKNILKSIMFRLNNPTAKIDENIKADDEIVIKELIGLLGSCSLGPDFDDKGCQRLKDFNECISSKAKKEQYKTK